jgi:hypothetical protein
VGRAVLQTGEAQEGFLLLLGKKLSISDDRWIARWRPFYGKQNFKVTKFGREFKRIVGSRKEIDYAENKGLWVVTDWRGTNRREVMILKVIL